MQTYIGPLFFFNLLCIVIFPPFPCWVVALPRCLPGTYTGCERRGRGQTVEFLFCFDSTEVTWISLLWSKNGYCLCAWDQDRPKTSLHLNGTSVPSWGTSVTNLSFLTSIPLFWVRKNKHTLYIEQKQMA